MLYARNMSWLTRLFGGEDAPPKPETPQSESRLREPEPAPKVQTWSGKKIVAHFAKHVPGARVLDFDGRTRDDGLLARATYTHAGVEARLAAYLSDGEFVVWLETRCPGIYGSFDVLHGEPDADDEDMAQRLYIGRERFVCGPRVRNEVARIRSLSRRDYDRLVELSDRVTVLKLEEEVVSLRLGMDAYDFLAMLDDKEKGVPYVLSLGVEASSLARAFPAQSKDVVALAESRTCRFCHATFVFSPEAPSCPSCGSPAQTASIMPPPPVDEIPDNPVVEDDDLEPGERDELMTKIRVMAGNIAALVDKPVLREEPDRVRVFVEYELDGRAFRAKVMEETVGIRTRAPGARGDFFLSYVGRDDTYGDEDNAAAWTESERRVFFSEHCRVSSDHTTKEALRLASLPEPARAQLLALCEDYESGAQLEDEHVAIGLSHRCHERGVQLVLETSRALAAVADALPRDYDDRDVSRFRLASCRYCGWAYFAPQGATKCLHCGAAAGE